MRLCTWVIRFSHHTCATSASGEFGVSPGVYDRITTPEPEKVAGFCSSCQRLHKALAESGLQPVIPLPEDSAGKEEIKASPCSQSLFGFLVYLPFFHITPCLYHPLSCLLLPCSCILLPCSCILLCCSCTSYNLPWLLHLNTHHGPNGPNVQRSTLPNCAAQSLELAVASRKC